MSKSMMYGRGDIVFINLDPTRGHEQSKTRPCVIISIDQYNTGASEMLVVIPLTSRHRVLSWFVEIKGKQTGLMNTSYAICDQIRTVTTERVTSNIIGRISSAQLQQIEMRLRILLGLSKIF